MSSLASIEHFLAHRRFAAIGVSRNPKDFSRYLVRELRARGYDIAAVNPHAADFDEPFFASVADVPKPVEAALVLTAPAATEQVARDCAAAGIKELWLYGISGRSSAPPAALDFCAQHGIQVIAGECPFMFLPPRSGVDFVHRCHGWVRKIMGSYPQA